MGTIIQVLVCTYYSTDNSLQVPFCRYFIYNYYACMCFIVLYLYSTVQFQVQYIHVYSTVQVDFMVAHHQATKNKSQHIVGSEGAADLVPRAAHPGKVGKSAILGNTVSTSMSLTSRKYLGHFLPEFLGFFLAQQL